MTIHSQRKTFPLWLGLLIVVLMTLILIIIFSDKSVQNKLTQWLNISAQWSLSEVAGEYSTGSPEVEKVRVERVVDGDTIKLVDGRTVRYLNMDTPETKKPNSPIECFGPEASQLNKELVDGKDVYLMSDIENKDRYDRILRFVFLEDPSQLQITDSVNAQMVKNGFATVLVIKPNDTYANDFYRLEKEAQQKNLGLWSSCQN